MKEREQRRVTQDWSYSNLGFHQHNQPRLSLVKRHGARRFSQNLKSKAISVLITVHRFLLHRLRGRETITAKEVDKIEIAE